MYELGGHLNSFQRNSQRRRNWWKLKFLLHLLFIIIWGGFFTSLLQIFTIELMIWHQSVHVTIDRITNQLGFWSEQIYAHKPDLVNEIQWEIRSRAKWKKSNYWTTHFGLLRLQANSSQDIIFPALSSEENKNINLLK